MRAAGAVEYARQTGQPIDWHRVHCGECMTELNGPLLRIRRRDVRLAVKPADQRGRILRPPAVQVTAQYYRSQPTQPTQPAKPAKPVKRPQHPLLMRATWVTRGKLSDDDGELRVCSVDSPCVGMLATLQSRH
jgi:hypothetical protein